MELESWESLDDIEIPVNNTIEELEKRSNAEAIAFVLSTLTERERTALELFFFYRINCVQIASHFCISCGGANQLLHRALRKMRYPVRADFLKDDCRENISRLKRFKKDGYYGLTEHERFCYKMDPNYLL